MESGPGVLGFFRIIDHTVCSIWPSTARLAAPLTDVWLFMQFSKSLKNFCANTTYRILMILLIPYIIDIYKRIIILTFEIA